MFESFRSTKLKDQPERAKPIYDKAILASAHTNQLIAHIDSLAALLSEEGGGMQEKTGDLQKRSSLDISTRLMIKQGRAKILKDRINATRDKLNEIADRQVNFSLEALDPPVWGGIKKTWENANFGAGIPLTAAMTSLEKIKADIKNAESAVVKHIFGEMDMAVVNLDRFSAVAVAPSSYVIQGQPFSAEVFLTAYDSKSNPEIFIDGTSIPVTDGKGSYLVNTSKEGIFNWTGKIKVQQADGSVKEYETAPQSYQVAKPSAVVSPDKMNVLYIGVPNPISVSAPGIPKENLKVSITGGSLSGSNGKYSVNVTSRGEATVNVSATVSGKTQLLSSTLFRVKPIPKPTPQFGGKSGGGLTSVALKNQKQIFARLEDFEFDAKFTINRFSLVIAIPRADALGPFTASGNSLSPQMVSAMQNISAGARVIFDNIIATGPDGVQRTLDPMVFTAQ
jgi:gliding motility-associated protein GldM